jgi:hypothetical protein
MRGAPVTRNVAGGDRESFADHDLTPLAVADTGNEPFFFVLCGLMAAGPLVIEDEDIPPTGRPLDMPPEGYSLVFDASDRIVKMVGGGLVLDRTVGNTGGLGGE